MARHSLRVRTQTSTGHHRLVCALALLAAGASALPAQLWRRGDYYPRHNFTFGIGAAQPKADLKDLFFTRPGISVGYGYRFQKYFQADVGLDIVFGAAGVHDFLETGLGPLRIRDRQFFVPLGGRAILPLADGRFLVSGGGGAAYIRYQELLHQPSYDFRIDCPVCTTRDGWGYYALLDVGYYLNRNQNFKIGATAKVYRGYTQGEPLAGVPGVRTTDHWIQTYGQFGFSF